MAKRTPKETSLPLVFALVFFVLTTIAFGVLWYMQFSDQQAKDDAVKKANDSAKASAGEAADAILKARVYRIFLGIDEEKDKESVDGETKGKDKIALELKKINEAAAKAVGVEDASKLPVELQIWGLDEKGTAMASPKVGILPVVGDAVNKRNAAIKRADEEFANYKSAVGAINKAVEEFDKAKEKFKEIAKSLPGDFDKNLKAEQQKFTNREKLFKEQETKSRDTVTQLEEEKGKSVREGDKLKKQVKDLQEEIAKAIAATVQKRDVFEYDEPQGKVTRRLPDGVLEINLGSADLVRPGLTFTVLPNDFQEKGRRSRMRMVRVPNERGEYVSVERFIEKATIEVTEVLGPKLSRCRITNEFDPIRDGASIGDLLYNSVWRKGTADHIALVGIFDINGDGADDIETVVRDLSKMGIPVDAYFDLKKRQWVGQLNEQTRYIVEGAYPINSATDPNQAEKTKLIASMSDAVNAGRAKGVQSVNYRDFFPRMGYRVKLDITADRVNQATAPYLNRVATVDSPPAP